MQFANRLAGCELINSEWSADVRFGAHSGLKSDITALPKSADLVAKVFLGRRTKIFRAADASYARRREGPYRFVQNRLRTFLAALKSSAAAVKSKNQLSRDFWS
jgi:hypothetical protein